MSSYLETLKDTGGALYAPDFERDISANLWYIKFSIK